MKLIYEDSGKEVSKGDKVGMHNHDGLVEVTDIVKPHHGGSTGRVYVQPAGASRSTGYYPSVIGAKWIEREDQEDEA